jgi:hypothetical protein
MRGSLSVPSSLTAPVVAYTIDVPLLVVGLASEVWVSVGLRVLMAMRHALSQVETGATQEVAAAEDQDPAEQTALFLQCTGYDSHPTGVFTHYERPSSREPLSCT